MSILTIKTQEKFDSKVIDKRFYYDGDVIFKCDIYSPKINIKAWNIQAGDIKARNIKASDINARDINACNIKAYDINARDIEALNINAWNIDARNIDARNIDADDINANNIDYHAVCFTYCKLKAKTIKGRHSRSRHFSLSDDLEIG